MKRILIVTLLIILYGGLISIYASEVLILNEDEAVELGLKQNLNLKMSELNLETSLEEVDNSWNTYLPNFSFSTGISRSEVFLSGDSDTDPWKLNIKGGISLSLSFTDKLNIKANEILLKSQKLQYNTSEKNLEKNIRTQFKYLVASKENLTLQEKNIALAQKRYEQAKINFGNGLISELSLLTTQNSVETLKPKYQDADTSYRQQIMSFQSLLGMDLSQSLELRGNLNVDYYDLDPNILIENFLNKRLDVTSTLINIEIQENLLKINKTNSLAPSLSLSTSWDNSINTLFDSADWVDSTSISATINIPINGYITGSTENLNIKKSERSIEESKLSLINTKSIAEEEIRSILMELEGAWANIETTELSVNLAQKTYEMTEQAFQKGSSELLDVEDAQNKLLSAKQDLLLSKYSYLAGILDLESALNANITEILKIINK